MINSQQVNLRNRHFFLLDLVLLVCAPFLALLLRVNSFEAILQFAMGLLNYTLFVLCVRLICFYWLGLYRHYWQYASVPEMGDIAFMVGLSSVVVSVVFFASRPIAFDLFYLPRSLPLIESLLVLVLVGGTRFSVRLYNQIGQRPQKNAQQVLVVGAGEAGSMIVKELKRSPRLGLRPVGFVDDDGSKQGMLIHGIPVWGSLLTLTKTIRRLKVDQVIIAMPTAPGRVIRQVVETCEAAGLRPQTIPGIYELIDGTVTVNQLRDVQIEDLLRRDSVETDITAVQALLKGQRVLITGGGGSIGSELCRQILRSEPSHLILVGHGENSIFAIYHELKRLNRGATQIEAVIADTRLAARLHSVLRTHRPAVVFHAAAHKHVPLMEMNPSEAITNNVLGTRNLLEASLAVGVKRFVMISTDKAVNPTSLMGASKRVAEMLVHKAAKESGRPFVAVRFGNVLGSRGSVVLTFQRQIAQGGPITITHPDIERFFMTIPEAVQLVLQAAVLGEGEEVFVLDMGKPIKILDMAHDLIRLSGLEVGRDIEVVFTGLRPGEKLYEELFIDSETYVRTCHEKIFLAANASQLIPAGLANLVDALEAAGLRDDVIAIRRLLGQIIPEFHPNPSSQNLPTHLTSTPSPHPSAPSHPPLVTSH